MLLNTHTYLSPPPLLPHSIPLTIFFGLLPLSEGHFLTPRIIGVLCSSNYLFLPIPYVDLPLATSACPHPITSFLSISTTACGWFLSHSWLLSVTRTDIIKDSFHLNLKPSRLKWGWLAGTHNEDPKGNDGVSWGVNREPRYRRLQVESRQDGGCQRKGGWDKALHWAVFLFSWD